MSATEELKPSVHDGELWGKCSECKERQGYYLDAETIRNQQEHIAELERQLEALQVVDWWTDEHGDTHAIAANGQEVCHYVRGEHAELGGETNPDGLPVGLTVSEDGGLLNWRGENYVRQSTLGARKAMAHPYGYEPDTGAFDVTRCECGCLNDISATYCNDCGGVIEVDMNAEKEIYHIPRHMVFAVKHDDGSLEYDSRRYTTTMLGDDGYEAKMDALLCRLTNGKWSKSRAYDLDFMVSCVDEEYEMLYARDLAEQESETCDAVRDERTQTIVCSKCGGGGLTIPNKGQKALRNFCPNCGARIRKAVER